MMIANSSGGVLPERLTPTTTKDAENVKESKENTW